MIIRQKIVNISSWESIEVINSFGTNARENQNITLKGEKRRSNLFGTPEMEEK